jgi:glucan phosphoethanolaminetransferase (alkaline phosphatase superfamily)
MKIVITGNQFTIMVGIVSFVLCISFIVALIIIRRNNALFKEIFISGVFMRILTIVFIVVVVFFLSISGNITTESATILSGITGYVLGGISKKENDTKQVINES